MASYYELLQVQPTATADEVDAACTTLYNKWRRLVTHHTADVRNQAMQALEQLEGIRATLSDPVARAAYDAGIGLKGQIGGLADPDAVLAAAPAPAVPTMTPPSTRLSSAAPASTVAARPSLWTCPKNGCGAENPPNTKFCLHCGTQLVRECPACHKMASLVASGFCGECGENYSVVTERQELEAKIAERLPMYIELTSEVDAATIYIDTMSRPANKGVVIAILGIASLGCLILGVALVSTSLPSFFILLAFCILFFMLLLWISLNPDWGKADLGTKHDELIDLQKKQSGIRADLEQLLTKFHNNLSAGLAAPDQEQFDATAELEQIIRRYKHAREQSSESEAITVDPGWGS